MTGALLGRRDLRKRVAALRDRRRTKRRYFPEAKSPFEQALARKHTPAAARAWGLWMNAPEESFRALMERHA